MKPERKTIYIEHPVTPEQKQYLATAGYKMIDAKFVLPGEPVHWFDAAGELRSTDDDFDYGDSGDAPGTVDEKKTRLIAELKKYGIKKTKTSNVETLEALLAEAKGE